MGASDSTEVGLGWDCGEMFVQSLTRVDVNVFLMGIDLVFMRASPSLQSVKQESLCQNEDTHTVCAASGVPGIAFLFFAHE